MLSIIHNVRVTNIYTVHILNSGFFPVEERPAYSCCSVSVDWLVLWPFCNYKRIKSTTYHSLVNSKWLWYNRKPASSHHEVAHYLSITALVRFSAQGHFAAHVREGQEGASQQTRRGKPVRNRRKSKRIHARASTWIYSDNHTRLVVGSLTEQEAVPRVHLVHRSCLSPGWVRE